MRRQEQFEFKEYHKFNRNIQINNVTSQIIYIYFENKVGYNSLDQKRTYGDDGAL